MTAPNIIAKLKSAELLGRVLADLLALSEPPEPGGAIRCIHPDRHKNGDANPSLVVWQSRGGATCQACGFRGGLLDIAVERLGLPDRKSAAAELERRYLGGTTGKVGPRSLGDPVATYDYTDEDARILFQSLRFETTDAAGRPDKTFRLRRPDPKRPGKWVWKLAKTRVVPYRLPAVRRAIEAAETIYVVEGEKDVGALESVGVTATTNHGGANKWRPEHTEALRGAKQVVVVADKDKPGYRHALHIAAALTPVVGSVRVVEAKTGKDAADHLAAGHAADEFVEVEVKPESVRERTESLPEIVVRPAVAAVVDEAETALLASRVELYQRLGTLVRVMRDEGRRLAALQRPARAPVMNPLPTDSLFEACARSAIWIRITEYGPKQIIPPKWAVKVLESRGRWEFPYLEGVVEAPVLRVDGTVLDRAGYDEFTGLLYEPNADYPAVPERPGAANVQAAFATLLEPFSEFPFVSDADRAAALAAILTLAARHTIYGPTPLFALLSPTPGTGKGLFVHAVVLLGTGRYPSLMAAEHDNDELRKVITTVAMEGHQAVLFDNAEGTFGSSVLAGALTATEWSGRILGLSKTATAPLSLTWFVTGNNLSFVGDTCRRVIPIRIDARVERPEAREFQHPDLLHHIGKERPRLFVAALTLLRAFILTGRPHHGAARMGSFEAWDDLVRSAVVWLMGVDPCETRERLREHDDSDREMLRALLNSWAATFPNGKTLTARESLRAAKESSGGMLYDALLGISEDASLPTAQTLGYALRRWRGRIVDGLQFDQADKTRQGSLWRVVPAPGSRPPRRDDGDDGDDVSARSQTELAQSRAIDSEIGISDDPNHRHDVRHRHTQAPSGPGYHDVDPDEYRVVSKGHEGAATPLLQSLADAEAAEERAAMLEYEAGLSREEAEKRAEGERP